MRLTTPLMVSLEISHGGRSKPCSPKPAASPTAVGPNLTVIVVVNTPEHSTVTVGAVVGTTSDIIKTSLQQQISIIMKSAYG